MDRMRNTRFFCCSEHWINGIFYQIEPSGDTLTLDSSRYTSGLACLPPLDGGEKGFSWSRVTALAHMPEDSAMRFYARASDDAYWGGWDSFQRDVQEGAGDPSTLLRRYFGSPVAKSGDFYLSCTGRYLWLALELAATGGVSPVVERIALRMGGDHMADYLPAIYQEDSFTRRFLSIFDSFFSDMEEEICALPERMDYESARGENLRYLASWVCQEWGDGAWMRERIRTALPDFERMYTLEGIRRTVEYLTGGRPYIIEHFSVDPNRPECRNPQLYRKLYGKDPYRFFILLKDDTFHTRDQIEGFLAKMETLIPAGIVFELILLKPCVQLDWHTYLGINSRVSDYVPAVIGKNVTIHYDITIEDSKPTG